MKRTEGQRKKKAKSPGIEQERRIKNPKKAKKVKNINFEDELDDWDDYELTKIREREKLEDYFDDDEIEDD